MDNQNSRFFTKADSITIARLCQELSLAAMIYKDKAWQYSDDASVMNLTIESVTSLSSGKQGSLSYFATNSMKQNLQESEAQFCIIHESNIEFASQNMVLLISQYPDYDFARACNIIYPDQGYGVLSERSISEKADIDSRTKIGKNAHIEAGVIVRENVEIGDNCYIGANTVIYPGVIIGDNCRIGANGVISHAIIGNSVTISHSTVIGKEGFGFATRDGVHHKILQLGKVVIEDNVELGAMCVVDRGALDDTIIHEGAKIGDLVDVAHNGIIGKGTIVVSQTGFAGSVTVGEYVVIGGQVGFSDHLTIGSYAKIAAKSGVIRDVPDHDCQGGFPAITIKEWHKQTAMIKKITKKK